MYRTKNYTFFISLTMREEDTSFGSFPIRVPESKVNTLFLGRKEAKARFPRLILGIDILHSKTEQLDFPALFMYSSTMCLFDSKLIIIIDRSDAGHATISLSWSPGVLFF